MRRPRWSIRRARLLIGTKFMLIAGLVGIVLLAWLSEQVLDLGPKQMGVVTALCVATVPAGLWLMFFYLMDRHEPEPKQLVLGVCALGGFVAAPLADFTQWQLAPSGALEQHGLSPLSFDHVIQAVFVVGLAQEMCKYVAVRYSVYMSREFDEPMDGIVYMMACGTGFAVWINYHRLSAQGHQVLLSTGTAQSVVTTLAHASFAGALGYVLGRAKFSRRGPVIRGLLLMGGLLGAAMLNGTFAVVENWLEQTGLDQHPWRGVMFAAICAGAVFALIWFGALHLLSKSPFRREDGA